MAGEQGKEASESRTGDPGAAETEGGEAGGARSAIPEMIRKAFSLGFSGFFLTETAIRKALGDALPKDWIDFAVEQSDRTRAEFIERLTFEVARSLEAVDLAAVLRELLEGRTLEVKAEIRLSRLGEPDAKNPAGKIRIAVGNGENGK